MMASISTSCSNTLLMISDFWLLYNKGKTVKRIKVVFIVIYILFTYYLHVFFLVKQKPFFFWRRLWLFHGTREAAAECITENEFQANVAKRGTLNMFFNWQRFYIAIDNAPQYISIHPQTVSTVSVFSVSLTLWFLHISSFLISHKSKEIRCLSTTYRLIDFWGLLFFCQSCLLHLQSGHFTAPHRITFTFEKKSFQFFWRCFPSLASEERP